MTIRQVPSVCLLLGVGGVAGFVICVGSFPPNAQQWPTAADIAEHDRAVKLMWKGETLEAVRIFAEMTGKYPSWERTQVNLAIATFCGQRSSETASGILQRVLARHPFHLQASYLMGLMHMHRHEYGQAKEYFTQVVLLHGEDAYAVYLLARCIEQTGDGDFALKLYRKATEFDPFFRTPRYARWCTACPMWNSWASSSTAAATS